MPQLFGFPRVPIPGPKPIPLIGGRLKLFRYLSDPVDVLFNLRTFGDVAAVIDGNPALVAVFGPERVKEVLSNPAQFQHDETIFTGPEGSQLDKLRYAIIAVNNEMHLRHRRLMMPAFQRSAQDGYALEIATVTAAVLDRWPTGQEVRLDALVRELALCMAVRCFYGMDVLGGATELGHLTSELVETLTNPLTLLAPVNLPGTPYRKAVNLADSLLTKLSKLVEEKRARGPGERDALSLLIHSVDPDGSGLSNDELIAEATSLFIAGHETIAMTVTWTIFLLERHPKELARVLDEIEATVGTRAPTPEDIGRMPVLDRVIKESMRVLPSVPVLFFRAASGGASIGGVNLPPKANLIVSPLMAHHDPKIFPEPMRFNPDRWIGFTPPPYTYMPYGGGPRTCLGAMFANQALRIILPMVLRRYRYSLRDGATVSRLTRANILLAKNGLWMRIEPYDRKERTPGKINGDISELVHLDEQ